MLRPSTSQFGAGQPFRLLDIGLIEWVHAELLAQALSGVFPAEELAAEIQWIGGKRGRIYRLHVWQRGRAGIPNNWNNTTSIFPRAFRDELLDPAGQRGELGGRRHTQFIDSRLGFGGNGDTQLFCRCDVCVASTLEQPAPIDITERRRDHSNGGERRIAPTHIGWMRDDRPEPPLAREDLERGTGFGDCDELLGARPGHEVVAEGERLD